MTTVSLWGAAFGFVTLGEVLSPTGVLGGMLIMGGCVLGNIGEKKKEQTLPFYSDYERES
jgi:drug/metabolite transporter (DMT)-like permease